MLKPSAIFSRSTPIACRNCDRVSRRQGNRFAALESAALTTLKPRSRGLGNIDGAFCPSMRTEPNQALPWAGTSVGTDLGQRKEFDPVFPRVVSHRLQTGLPATIMDFKLVPIRVKEVHRWSLGLIDAPDGGAKDF